MHERNKTCETNTAPLISFHSLSPMGGVSCNIVSGGYCVLYLFFSFFFLDAKLFIYLFFFTLLVVVIITLFPFLGPTVAFGTEAKNRCCIAFTCQIKQVAFSRIEEFYMSHGLWWA